GLSQGNFDLVNEYLEHALDLTHAQKNFHPSEVTVVPGEHNQGSVPRRSVDQRNEVVVPRLVILHGRNVRAFLAEAPDQNRSGDKFDSTKASRGILRVILAKHPPGLAVGPREIAGGERRRRV